ncbi:MAG: hypothetical protein HETSPECPRED_002516 [Heterodermia speciosa]|uniref:ATP-dependent DNA ligase family profile domain-containing protein n=1 Tax=Heterodermia speciosa TaxID=116794 RepID=A0A8H3F3U7_9LECA|nr:MAG: hypothetical protein HETSPECPRED_002516 [Heterodermia speciosa]
MPLLFSRLCDLFSDLEYIAEHEPPLLHKTSQQRTRDRIAQWFGGLNIRDSATDIDPIALLSAIFPQKRSDRVYFLKADSLSKKLRRVLCLGTGRWELLDQWKKPGRGDLGDCVLRVLRSAENPLPCPSRQVTVEEIDRVLAGIAKGIRFSAPKVQNADIEEVDMDKGLQLIYRRLQSREAKWFTRMILKDYAPLDISEALVYRCIDPQLPIAMKLHDNFEDAIRLLGDPGSTTGDSPLKPRVGTKVGRPSYRPARGIKHAVQTIKGRKMSVEQKYDGEYCQIHVDLRNPAAPFQLFSKSGKDSTADRVGLHQTLVDCLRLGSEDCLVTEKCILEGEMVVWSDREKRILDFCKIRKHVSRAGSFLGTLFDSQPHPWEHLMIVFFDVLLLDDHSLLPVPHASRRKLLEQLVSPILGRADLVTQHELDFSNPTAPVHLQKHFAQAIANRWEGLVLKPSDEPYFGPAQRIPNTYPSCWLKMKKDYIAGLGDTADFAVVGAGYDVKEATRRGEKRLNWTHFHIGCLKNKAAAIHLKVKPEYVVLDAVTLSISAKDMTYLNQHGQFRALEVDSPECSKLFGFEMTSGLAAKMTVAFRKPFVFEVMGGGFEKPPNSEIFRLRWPRVLKIHHDRDWKDAVTTEELQMIAAATLAVPIEEDMDDEVQSWQRRIDAADRGTRRAMLPWDDSQHEASDDQGQKTPPAVQKSQVVRSKRTVKAPLVRMDTGEMGSGEQRMPNGEVTRRSASQSSAISAASTISLPTPPTSSPVKKPSMKRAQTPITPPYAPSLGKKRTDEVIVIDDPPQPPKRLRTREQSTSLLEVSLVSPQSHSKRKSETTFLDETFPPAKRRKALQELPIEPLRETLNSSNRTRPFTPVETESSESKVCSKSEPFLVRKIPALTDARFLPKSRRKPWKPIIEPESPGYETTDSECSSQSAVELPHASPERPNQESKHQARHQQARSPAAHAGRDSVHIEIPNLLERRVMLSPCVYENLDILENYFPGRLNNIIPHPKDALSPESFPPTPPPSASSTPEEVVLLIEPKHSECAGKILASLHPYLPTCGYTIAIWSWKLLKYSPQQDSDSLPHKDMAHIAWKQHIGIMSHDALHHEICTAWRDGQETRTLITPLQRPDLLNTPVMLSPCVSNNLDILENYVHGRIGHLVPHPNPGLGIAPPPNPSKVEKKIILLVDAKNGSATGKAIRPVRAWLPTSGYERVEIWHWKVLGLREEQGGEKQQRKVEKRFYGALAWREGEGKVRTRWRGERVTRLGDKTPSE